MMANADTDKIVYGRPTEAERPLMRSIKRGLFNTCPACGSGRLFRAYLKPVEKCASCQEELFHERSDDLPPYIFDSKTKRLLDDKERSDVFFVSSNVHLNENSIDFLTIVPNGYPCFDGRITVSDLRTMTLRSLEEQFPIFPPIECSYDKLTNP